jgi:hypothetical protein
VVVTRAVVSCIYLFSGIINIALLSVASAQSTDGPLLLCRKLRVAQTPLDSKISLRLYPFDLTTKTIHKQGESLIQTIEALDLLAIRADALLQEIVAGNKASSKSKQIHLYARETTSNAVVLARASRIVVFPRVFLLHPRFANLQIKPGDFVGTVGLGRDNKQYPDELRKFLKIELQTPSNDEAQAIEIDYKNTLALSKEKLRLLQGQRRRSRVHKALDEKVTRALDTSLIVNVVRRSIGGLELCWISPEAELGLYGKSGLMWRSLITPELDVSDRDEYWHKIFDVHDITLMNQDSMEVVAAELLEVF